MPTNDKQVCVNQYRDTEAFFFSSVHYIISLSFAVMLAVAMYTYIANRTNVVPCLLWNQIWMHPPIAAARFCNYRA